MIFFKLLLITVVFLALAFAGFAIKMFIEKNGEFKKQCSSVDPQTGRKIGCGCSGERDGSCDNKDKEILSKIKIKPLHIDS